MEFNLLEGLTSFALYFFGSLVALLIFKALYALVTPHDEWKLIREDKNTAAAIGFGGAIIGFSIALSGAIANSISFMDFATWGVVALIAQIIAFCLVRFAFLKTLIQRIEKGENSAAIMLASMNIAVGVLNAACMTY